MKRILLLAFALTACDDTREGAAAFEAGRPKDALAAFAAAAERAGDSASPELIYDVALASLATGDHAAAVVAADLAFARDGDGFAGLRDFVHGNTAFARAELAEFQVDMPGNSQAALERALAEATAARDAWQRAASSRDAWPAATRNAERAEILLKSLETKKSDLETRSGKPRPRIILPKPKPPEPARTPASDEPDKPPLPLPPKPGPEKSPEPPKGPDAAQADLTREQVARLLERLAEKEREKTAARRAQRDVQPPDVEKDW